MTDLERTKEFLNSLDIGWEIDPEDYRRPGEIHLTFEDGMRNVKGYPGFMTTFEFDAEGKFISAGAWE